MEKHTEVVAFACGLLPDPSPLVDLAYTLVITKLTTFLITTNDELWTIFSHLGHGNAVLLESLYRESNIRLPGHHFHNQFINYYEGSDTKNLPADTFFFRHRIYCPSRVYVFSKV